MTTMNIPTVTNCPGMLAPGYRTYSPRAAARLFDGKRVCHMLDFAYDGDEAAALIAGNVGRISLSGVQEKLSATLKDGKVILTPPGEKGTYILKPVPSNRSLCYRHFMPANEHLTMQIARQVYDIPTAENGMIFFADGEPAYITRRFDVGADGSGIKQDDFASLVGRTAENAGGDFKYRGSYLDIAVKIRELLPAWQVEMTGFFRLVVFNYLFANGDAHLKNFSVQQTPDGDYRLAPAYDLLNSHLHVDDSDFALSKGLMPRPEWSDTYERMGHPCAEDFRRFGRLAGLNDKQTDKVLALFAEPKDEVAQLTERSFLDKRLQRMYLQSYKERLSRFNRR